MNQKQSNENEHDAKSLSTKPATERLRFVAFFVGFLVDYDFSSPVKLDRLTREAINTITDAMKEFYYNYETLAHLSGFSSEDMRKSISRGEIKVDDLRSVAIWLASKGSPDLRAEMARRLIPVVLGTSKRADQTGLHNIASSPDLLLQVFRRDVKERTARAGQAVETKKKLRRSASRA
jgi:hypothetical protein